jgi:predicted RNase H-like HicB family nuclease
MSKNIIDFQSARSIKELVLTANDTITSLENALYEIMDAKSLEEAKELAANALEEYLDIYLEEDDLSELDFSDGNILWGEIPEEDEEQ